MVIEEAMRRCVRGYEWEWYACDVWIRYTDNDSDLEDSMLPEVCAVEEV